MQNSLSDYIVSYFAINNIDFDNSDYLTGHSSEEADHVIHWNTEKLGEYPSDDELNRCYTLRCKEVARQSMNVTPFQAKAALLDANLLDDIEALMADPATDRTVVLAWNNVTEFRRLSPMVAGIASALGWSDEQLDTLFEAAALISA